MRVLVTGSAGFIGYHLCALLLAEVEGAITWYARPSFTRALVDLTKSVADEAIDDLPTLFDGVTPPPEEGEAEPAAPVEEAAPTGEVVGPQPG